MTLSAVVDTTRRFSGDVLQIESYYSLSVENMDSALQVRLIPDWKSEFRQWRWVFKLRFSVDELAHLGHNYFPFFLVVIWFYEWLT